MEKEKIISIPFVAHESAMNRMERVNKSVIIIAIVELFIILLMFAGIMIYFYLPSEVSTEETTTQIVDETNGSEINQSIGE